MQYQLKTPASHFVVTGKFVLKFMWKDKDLEQPTQYGGRTKFEDSHDPALRLTTRL